MFRKWDLQELNLVQSDLFTWWIVWNYGRQQMFRYSPQYRQVTNNQPIRVRLVFTALKDIRLHIIVDDSDDNRSSRLRLATVHTSNKVLDIYETMYNCHSLCEDSLANVTVEDKKILSVYQVTSYKPNFTLLAWTLPKLAY